MKSTVATYMKYTLDPLFSLYVRLKHSHQGYCQCVTCPAIKPYRDMDAGHYVGRGKWRTRYDERNVNPQCHTCNRNYEGSKPAYAVYLVGEYGPKIIEELDQLGNIPKQFRLDELKALAKWIRKAMPELDANK